MKSVIILSISAIVVILNISSTEAAITAFTDINFEGEWRRIPHFKACLDLIQGWDDRISSINTAGGCIMLCEHKQCKGKCERFAPGTWRHNSFPALEFNDKASSYKNC